MQQIKFNGHSVQKINWKQTDRRTDFTLAAECCLSVVGWFNSVLLEFLLTGLYISPRQTRCRYRLGLFKRKRWSMLCALITRGRHGAATWLRLHSPGGSQGCPVHQLHTADTHFRRLMTDYYSNKLIKHQLCKAVCW